MVQHLREDLDLSYDALVRVLDLAAQVKRTPQRFAQSLSGRYLGLLFEKPSLRTRVTFTIGVRELGGDIVEIPADVMHADREPIHDVVRNLDRWVDAVGQHVDTLGREAEALVGERRPVRARHDLDAPRHLRR